MNAVEETAKVFMTGRSQAVRLPKSCRFETAEVTVRRVGRSVVLTPKDDDWAQAIGALFEGLDGELGTGAALARPPEWKQRARKTLR